MPPAHRHTDICAGHPNLPPRPNVTASHNVFVNSLGQHRLTDGWPIHCCDDHETIAVTGSNNVYTNSLPSCRVGDEVGCDTIMASGSPDVFINTNISRSNTVGLGD